MKFAMIKFDASTAMAMLGKTIDVDVPLHEAPYRESYRVRIVGVALTLEDERPYFLVRDPKDPRRFPEELLWNDIHSLQVIDDKATASET